VSKLLDKLERISRGTAHPMGFRTKATVQKTSPVVLIAVLGQAEADAEVQSADAVLFAGSKLKAQDLEQAIASLGQIPWGVSFEALSEGELSRLREMGCDFLVLEAERAPMAVLREGEMAKVVEIEPSLADGLVGAIEQLPIDAVVIGWEDETSLSVHWLMVCQRLANLVRKPLVAAVPIGISREELEELSETGIAGVAVRLEGEVGELSRLRHAIDELPAPTKRRRDSPLLPRPGAEIAPPEEEED